MLPFRLLAGLFLLGVSGLAAATPVSEALQARLQPALAQERALRLEAASLPGAVAAFYADRQWAPVWDAPRLESLSRALDGLAGDGLDPAWYGEAELRRLAVATAPSDVAAREVAATRACLLALLHLYRGKVDPARLDAHWNFPPRNLAPAQALREVEAAVAENRVEDLFDRARPAWGYYDRLRIALAQLRRLQGQGGWPELPTGPSLTPGMSDARVPLLRRRLELGGLLPPAATVTVAPAGTTTGIGPGMPAPAAMAGKAAAATSDPALRYDEALAKAVERFQREANLEADGRIGPATRAELNVPVAARIAQVRANLERMRWFQNELQRETVIVDLAGYRILYLRDGEVKWTSRVQVGRDYRPSPVFQSTITYLTLSPGWVVPPTILREDALPAIRSKRGYLAKNKLHVYNAAGQELAPSAVNWWRPGNITLRQEPGPDGALGEVVIRFDNPYSVYLHDTPHKELFGASRRATSSGCIRVENVHELAVLLLDDAENWNRKKLQEVINERITRKVPLAHGVPILLAYWTVQVDPDGYVAFRPDIYHRDGPVLEALDAPL